jgi:pimeloyl-ACP methyl ester carboxylesterase
MATFVIVHGAFDGGWAWRQVAAHLRVAGHEVFTPTLTGSGERVHLARPDIDLNTHIQDIVNVLLYEDVRDVILVGSSNAGMVITGVADRMTDRIGRLVYLDALVPRDGETAMDLLGSMAASVLDRAREPGAWRIQHDPPDADRRTDVMLAALMSPLKLRHPVTVPCLFIHCTAKPADSPAKPVFETMAARAREAGWDYRELKADHWPPLENPREVAELLLEVV